MTTMGDLPKDLVEEIFSRVPMTSVKAIRSTCKKWNALSKSHVFGKKAVARKHFRGFLMKDSRVCTMKFDLEEIRNNDGNFVDPSIKQVSTLDQVVVSQIFHCNGLLLCSFEDNLRLLVWNPYLGQTRWIQPRISFKKSDTYALGYDNNHNHKILRIFVVYRSRSRLVYGFEIYNFSSNSWKVLHVTPDWMIRRPERGVSLKGNTYFTAQKIRIVPRRDIRKQKIFLLCFDFTTESFGYLPMPFYNSHKRTFVSLSCVGEDQLAVLYQFWETDKTIEIRVTDKIDPIGVSWREFLKHDISFRIGHGCGSFFIDEEKKVAVIIDEDYRYQAAHIYGQDGYFRSVIIGLAREHGFLYPPVCSSYVPSLVQLQINQPEEKNRAGKRYKKTKYLFTLF